MNREFEKFFKNEVENLKFLNKQIKKELLNRFKMKNTEKKNFFFFQKFKIFGKMIEQKEIKEMKRIKTFAQNIPFKIVNRMHTWTIACFLKIKFSTTKLTYTIIG